MSSSPATSPSVAARIVIKPKKAQPFFGRHPWVLSSAIDRIEPTSLEGEHFLDLDGKVVDLISDKGKFIARGLYNSRSRITTRLYTWSPEEELDEAFWRKLLAEAIDLRKQIGYEPQTPNENRGRTAARLVFSEADGLSGLVVDRYGDYLVLMPTSLAIAQRIDSIAAALRSLVQPKGMVLRTDPSMLKLEGMELAEGRTWGAIPKEPITIEENGVLLEVDLRGGQKTGFYLDQRENRRAVAEYLRGLRVLDMFCYTGGFSVAAAKGGAAEVLGVDGSAPAIARAQANAERNGLTSARFEVADGFERLESLAATGERFDAVILDPPKFARGRSGVNTALMAYHRLNRTALNVLRPGGILVTCSCSGSVTREDFQLMLGGVAQKSGRNLRLLEQRGAAPDHPVSATCLETDYLKCFICRVE
jgi:23S rRNA (cytosine1962-C5)-methyltransferase